ncbi:MAG TPA: tetratricopeptide repeat protein [Armatimonadaceae bacterium]|nr:tetratricopeptide repeat protein [Armatimonadaceae bacterium]
MRNERNRYTQTPPRRRSLLPLLLLTATVVYLLGGCALNSALTTSLLTPEQRLRGASESIDTAIAALNRGETALADRALARAVGLLGEEGYAEVGRRLTEGGRPADVARLLEPATKRKETAGNPVLWATLAEAADKAGDSEGAKRHRAEAARRAEEIVKTAGKTKPGSGAQAQEAAQSFMRAGVYYTDFAGDPKSAIAAYREAVRLFPDNPLMLNNLGYILADFGATPEQLEEAVKLTRRAVEIAPREPIFLDSYGWALFKRANIASDDLEAARRILREAVDMAPDVPELRFHLGVVYGALGLTRDAEIELERAVRLRPNFKAAREARAQLKSAPSTGRVLGATWMPAVL